MFDYVDALRERERWCYCVLPPLIVPGVSLLYRYRIGWLFIYSCKQRHLTKNETTKRERRRESERDDIQSDIIRIHSRKRRHRGREMIKAKAWITSNRYAEYRTSKNRSSFVYVSRWIDLRPLPSQSIVRHFVTVQSHPSVEKFVEKIFHRFSPFVDRHLQRAITYDFHRPVTTSQVECSRSFTTVYD